MILPLHVSAMSCARPSWDLSSGYIRDRIRKNAVQRYVVRRVASGCTIISYLTLSQRPNTSIWLKVVKVDTGAMNV